MPMVRTHLVPASDATPSLVVHAGAGGRIAELSDEQEAAFREGLTTAHRAGREVLDAGGSALDAVTAAVVVLEDDPLFNAGRGAALTLAGGVELDSSVMAGDGRAGAVAAVTRARNPVRVARHVMEATSHVLLACPDDELVAAADVELMEPDYFITDARRRQLERILANQEAPLKHGTVGCVARDSHGCLAAATSTGGISKQLQGRVGDSPVIGAGTWARDGLVAISCTGDGEAFIQGAVAHDVFARMAYGGQDVETAATATFASECDPRDSTGGLIAVTADGSIFLCHNSAMMFAAFHEDGDLVSWL
ncbi:isoaspartyl peptidase/L-asparaginase [Luteococcus sp. H138]|uniref:isoaspartyl peptidase/L-asparaginase family protein n=1 Tax=unclassified Luteococcus TaxID=2639923 RepID=UPI00313F3A23